MSEVAEIISDLVKAGVDAALVGRVAAALASREPVLVPDEQAERRRERDRERKRLRNSAESAERTPPKKEIPPTPPKEKTTPTSFSEAEASSNETRARFAEFWTLFPNKVGKRDAEKAFAAALRRAPFEAIMAGLRRYVAKTDDRPWCNPTTFLNQDRWEDQPAEAQPRSQAPPKRDTYVDAMNRILEGRANGTENLFGTDGDAQRLPADGKRQGIDVADVRGGIAGRIVSGSG